MVQAKTWQTKENKEIELGDNCLKNKIISKNNENKVILKQVDKATSWSIYKLESTS